MERKFMVWGSVLAFLAVALGAFGAHALEGKLAENFMNAFQTGVQYQMYHALGLIGLSLAADKLGSGKLVRRAGWLLIAGVLLFSGSLYVMSLTGIRQLGIVTPFGGVAFLAGWACLAAAVLKRK